MAAFENFIKGLLAETPATAVNFLRAALTSFPRYDRARLALWDVYVEQGDHQRALAAVQSVPSGIAVGAPRALSRGCLAAQPEEARRCVRDVQGTGRPGADADCAQQPGRRPAPSRRQPAKRIADVLLRQGRAGRPRRSRLLLQSRLRVLGGARLRRRRSTGCAKRFGGTPPTARRISFSAPRWRRRARPPSRLARRSWRGGCRRPTRSGTSVRPPTRCPRGWSASRRTKSSCRTPGGSTRRSRRPGSGISRSLPRSIWIARGGCSSRKAIGKRLPSSIARCICRRTSPTRICCSDASICGTAGCARPSMR